MAKQEMEDLKREVSETTTVEQSAVTLITGLKARLDAAIAEADWEGVKQLSADLDASQTALGDAIAANTPADPNAEA